MTDNSGNSATEPPKRVLIVLLGAIGDVVRALPLLGRIRHAWPHAHLAWAVEPKSRPLLEGHPWLDQLIVYDRARAPWSFAPFLIEVRRGGFDLVLDLQRHFK
ncbi:MAG: glycosyltransferase family 9 protein, partial [Candidatus Binataceae bacterium]